MIQPPYQPSLNDDLDMPNVERIYNENILAVDVALQDSSKETFEL